jgi:release factor glutamine methyltransferase
MKGNQPVGELIMPKSSTNSPRHFAEWQSFDRTQVYQPAEDSWLLAQAAKCEAQPLDRILEIGVGSGAVSEQFSLTHFVVGTDINPHAVRLAHTRGIHVIRADLFSGLCTLFDLILFNPPYLPTQPEERVNDWLEYALDGGEDGCDTIERFFAHAQLYLTDNGRVLVLFSSLNNAERVNGILQTHGWNSSLILEEIVEGERLYVLRCVPHAV